RATGASTRRPESRPVGAPAAGPADAGSAGGERSMICTRCNTDNRPTAAFCRDCGAILGGACPVCGAKCAPENRFCDMCGAPLAGIPSLAGAPARFGPRRGYTPNHLTDRILTSRSAMQGERKQITVLFADIKSSMELLMDRDPEDARRLLDPVIEL